VKQTYHLRNFALYLEQENIFITQFSIGKTNFKLVNASHRVKAQNRKKNILNILLTYLSSENLSSLFGL